jgi:hypothetical protein
MSSLWLLHEAGSWHSMHTWTDPFSCSVVLMMVLSDTPGSLWQTILCIPSLACMDHPL